MLRQKPAQLAAAATASALVLSAGPVAVQLVNGAGSPAALDRAHSPRSVGAMNLLGKVQTGAGPLVSPSGTASPQPATSHADRPIHHPRHARADTPAQSAASPQPAANAAPGYQNPLRAVSGLISERIDEGVDFGGAGPVYALGDAVITNAQGDNGGWPGGGWITYQLTDGPDAGLVVYLAEDVTPTVQMGQHVTSSTVIANMYDGGDGIETGWATQDGSTAESQMPEAGGISGGGPFPSVVGASFEALLLSLGVPAGNNYGQAASGALPAGYPST